MEDNNDFDINQSAESDESEKSGISHEFDKENNSARDNSSDDTDDLDYSTSYNKSGAEPSIPDDGYRSEGVYTTPDGRNGYVRYSDEDNAKKNKKRSVPIAVFIAVAVVAVLLLFISLFAGMMYIKDIVNKTLQDELGANNISETDTTAAAEYNTESDEPYNPLEKKEPIKSEDSEVIITSAGFTDSLLPKVIAQIKDTVVVITTESSSYNIWYGQYITSGAGSGVVIRSNGEIITNYHVVEGATEIKVTMTDGKSYPAKLKAYDKSSDIALLEIKPDSELKTAKLGCSEDLVVGEDVIAIGNPLGTLGGTVTTGIISATARSVKIDDNIMVLLQTNAAVSPGNSGGGLFNLAGELIGIVNAKMTTNSAEGLGFAIPIDHAYTVISQLEEYGYVKGIVDTGLELYEATRSAASYYFKSNVAGLYVVSSKYSDDIIQGDRIVTVNGIEITSQYDFENALLNCSVGDKVSIVVERISVKNQRYVSNKYTVSFELHEYVPDDLNK